MNFRYGLHVQQCRSKHWFRSRGTVEVYRNLELQRLPMHQRVAASSGYKAVALNQITSEVEGKDTSFNNPAKLAQACNGRILFLPRSGFVQQGQSSRTGFSVAALRLLLKNQPLIGDVEQTRFAGETTPER